MTSPTKKLLNELAKSNPIFGLFDPLKAMNLSKGGKVALDHVASLYLADENSSSTKSKPRKAFSKLVKLQVLLMQGDKCKVCRGWLDVVDYHHIDGNRANNSITNCEALCPNCHARKSRKQR